MKNFKQLIKELPSSKIVVAYGDFQPPTSVHEHLVKAVKTVAGSSADYTIYASANEDKKYNPLPVDRKIYFLNRMFPGTNFQETTEQTIVGLAKKLNEKYKVLTVVVGEDKVADVTKQLTKANGKEFTFESIKVVSTGSTDPDSDLSSGVSGLRMCESAKSGKFNEFKKGLPHTLTEHDSRRLMNEVRKGLGQEPIKEVVEFQRSSIREQYIAGEIFNVGDKVQDDKGVYEVMDRGANYITVVNESGVLSKKWIDKVTVVEDVINKKSKYNLAKSILRPDDFEKLKKVQEDIPGGYAPKEISFKGYTTKNLHHSSDAAKAFQQTIAKYQGGLIKDGVAVLNALKHTDEYMQIGDTHLEQMKPPIQSEVTQWIHAHMKAKESLERIGEFLHHMDYWDSHGHELQMLMTNYKEAGKGEVSESHNTEGTMANDKLRNDPETKRVMLRYKDFIKTATMTEPPVEMGQDSASDYKKPEEPKVAGVKKVDDKQTESDIDSEVKKTEPKHVATGFAMQKPFDVNDTLRRQKVKYQLGEDVYASDYVVHQHVDPVTGKTKSHKIRPNRINFAASGAQGGLVKDKKPKMSALDKWRAGADVRAKQQQADAEYYQKQKNKPYSPEADKERSKSMSASIDKLAKRLKEEIKKSTGDLKDACWTGYTAVGMKMKNGKKVPNCVPVKEELDELIDILDEAVDTIDKGEYDYEGAMARTQLQTIARSSTELIMMLTPYENMPEWVQSKITLAQDYITCVKDYLKSREELGEGYKPEHNLRPGWMVKSDPELKKKIDAAKARRAEFKRLVGKDVKKPTYEAWVLTQTSMIGKEKAEPKQEQPEEVETDPETKQSGWPYLGESKLNPANVHKDYQEKNKVLQQLSMNKDVDQKAVQQRKLDLDKEYSKVKNEEVEQIDELDKSTVKSYLKKKISKPGVPTQKDVDGIGRATVRLMNKEEVESELEEAKKKVLKPKADTATLTVGGTPPFDPFFEEHEIDEMVNEYADLEDMLEEYDDSELILVDEETGEEFEVEQDDEPIMEVLSRVERLKSKVRFARGSTKRGRLLQIRLKTKSTPERINQRAKRLAMRTLKQKIVKKPLGQMSISDKERAERVLHNPQFQSVINRLAMKMANRVRETEAKRMHKLARKASPNAKHNIKKR
jgi:hypothetical protein